MTELSAETRQKLSGVSTATLTTALFKRGLMNVFIQGPQRVNPGENMVGPAYTMRCIPAREDIDTLELFKDPENAQRKSVHECPAGAVYVVDSQRDPTAASCGGILGNRLQYLGCAGVVTDGGFRDSSDFAALKMPAYHVRPSAPTNLTKHHPVAINEPIGCGGVAVYPGDIMVGDADGVVCIPAYMADEIAAEAVEMTVFEDFVMEKVQGGAATFGLYPPTDPQTLVDFKAWRQQQGR